MTSPTSTYRLQITERFTLDDATAVVDYLHDLGAGWLYLSPILTAEAGSEHGYDIVDHAAVDPARGGPDGLRRLSTAAHAAGMGVIVDIVPNHVGIASPPTSRWWWDLLTHGPDSPHAARFDVEWDAAGRKVRLPILGDEPTPELAVVDGQLRYHEHRFPLAPGTDTAAPIAEILAAQHYELVNWRRADAELNYRRFFGISSLAGIRVEDPTVFEESHREIRRWVQDGLVDGLRVDHIDGLADPGRYLHDLRAATGVGYVVVEKILQRDERLPDSWDVEGTTGYDALADIDRVLIDPRGRDTLDRRRPRAVRRGRPHLERPRPPRQARRHRRAAAVRGAPSHPSTRRPGTTGRRRRSRPRRRRRGRTVDVLPRVPLVPADRRRAPAARRCASPTTTGPTSTTSSPSSCRCWRIRTNQPPCASSRRPAW